MESSSTLALTTGPPVELMIGENGEDVKGYCEEKRSNVASLDKRDTNSNTSRS